MRVDYAEANPTIWRWTPGFRYVVSAGERPIPIADEVIAMVAHRLDNQAAESDGRRTRLPFAPGDLVRIKRGPFRDMLGVFEGPNDPQQRVRVLLESMQKSMRVRLSPDDLEKAEAAAMAKRDKLPRRSRGRGRPIATRS
jgi:transcription antitermination factor NusG